MIDDKKTRKLRGMEAFLVLGLFALLALLAARFGVDSRRLEEPHYDIRLGRLL